MKDVLGDKIPEYLDEFMWQERYRRDPWNIPVMIQPIHVILLLPWKYPEHKCMPSNIKIMMEWLFLPTGDVGTVKNTCPLHGDIYWERLQLNLEKELLTM